MITVFDDNQWLIECRFADGRPPVEFTRPFSSRETLMKFWAVNNNNQVFEGGKFYIKKYAFDFEKLLAVAHKSSLPNSEDEK